MSERRSPRGAVQRESKMKAARGRGQTAQAARRQDSQRQRTAQEAVREQDVAIRVGMYGEVKNRYVGHTGHDTRRSEGYDDEHATAAQSTVLTRRLERSAAGVARRDDGGQCDRQNATMCAGE